MTDFPDVSYKEFHEAADKTNDLHDHAELHAAGEILFSDPIYATSQPYIRQWLEGLVERYLDP